MQIKIRSSLCSETTPVRVNTNTWRIPDRVTQAVYASANGRYQSDLLWGMSNWTGSDLVGEASKYAASYARSRYNLIKRINQNLPRGWRFTTNLQLQNGRWHRVAMLQSPKGAWYNW